MKCKLCHEEAKLIKSHIIPESFYKPHLKDGPALLISSDPDVHTKNCPIGVYDPEIVCEKCERLFSNYDNYANEFFLRSFESKAEQNGLTGKQCYLIRDYDYKGLKLFFVSLIWRALVSNRPEFSTVKTDGIFEEEISTLIKNDDPGEPENFSVIIQIIENQKSPYGFMPMKELIKGINVFRIYLANYKIWIKVDRRPFPEPLKSLILKPDNDLYVLRTDYYTDSENKLIYQLAKKHEQSKNSKKN